MKERIKKYIEYKGISAGDLSTKLDVQRSNISHILNGRNKPGAAFIEKLLLTFPDLNARWLLTGQGEMTYALIEKSIVTSDEIPFQEEVDDASAITKAVESISSEQKNTQPVLEDKVRKMILLFDDGTFTTYKNRDK